MTTGVNLIPAKLQWHRQVRRRRAAWVAAVGVYAGLLALACFAWRVAFVTPPATLADEIQHARHEVDEHSAELAKLRSALADHRAAMRISETLGARPDWSNLLALVSHACAGDVVLKRFDVAAPGELAPPDRRPAPPPTGAAPVKPPEPPRPVLRLQGLAQSQAAMSRFALRLEQLGIFESIEPSSSRESFEGSEVVSFRFDCWLLSSSSSTATGAPRRRASARAADDTTGAIP